MSLDEIKKRNHYIPKVYLRRFQNNETKLFVYKKGKEFFNEGITKEDRLLTCLLYTSDAADE